MLISDVSVRRPVFAAVISLILVIVGVMAVSGMSIREYPDIQRPVVSISTNYRGAASDIVERRVTQVLEDQIAGIAGITKISSRSFDERSRITLEFSRDRDVDDAANDVRDRVSRVLNNLPDEADPPEVSKQDSSTATTMWLNVSSDTRSVMEVSDFADRYLVDALSVVDGVAFVRGSGRRRPAMRIWVDPQSLAARCSSWDMRRATISWRSCDELARSVASPWSAWRSASGRRRDRSSTLADTTCASPVDARRWRRSPAAWA